MTNQFSFKFTASMTERLTRVPRDRKSGVQIPEWPNLTQRCKRFATASTCTQVTVLPWRYEAELDTAKLLHVSA